MREPWPFQGYGTALAPATAGTIQIFQSVTGIDVAAKTKSEVTKDSIMAAAIAVIAKEGVQGATTRKIAAQAGINLGSLHYHFEGKDAMLLSVLSYLIESSRAALTSYFTETEPLADRIEHLMVFIRGAVERHPEQQIALFNLTLYALSTSGSEWLAKKKYEEYLGLYRDALNDASDVRDGTLKPDIEALANFIFTGFVGILMQWLATANGFRARQAVQTLVMAARKTFL
ncbi:TetR family transcriptional regulator [Niveispirillum sp. SYP-B3756]|uniref:TetR/AcrR family transcriptional regulator n=1 Tax=Niveispirillum sp. SYP-B3756 TaxID=2662178 RepID=UPI0012918E9E|nr:TetR/AcrR family transcriptional regulator [Niveispirillum sp. SYP-B3756]MQP66239.1 TetR family transcriptional regulator [Niveispirillum sp. SYP-B3756]